MFGMEFDGLKEGVSNWMGVLIRTRPAKERGKELVYAYHANPEKLDKEEKRNGVMVDGLPEKPETSPNQKAQLYYNPGKEECFYETKEKKEAEKESKTKGQDRQFQREVIRRLDSIEKRLDGLEEQIG